MRFIVVGIFLFFLATAAFGQAEGEVELIGFGGWYRPHCWVPMKLRIRPTIGETETYRIQVIQEDMDRDRVSYSRPFTLNGNRPGERREEQVWAYFRPQPSGLGSVSSAADLSSIIRVFLCKGEKQLVQIKFSAGTGLRNLDAATSSGRGTRLVVGVATAGSQPNLSIYNDAYAMMEDIIHQPVNANDLPTNPLGYDSVDDLLWNHPDPAMVNPDAISAIEEWVKSGGRMVVCQSIEWQKMRDGPFAAMLPVVPTGMVDEKNAGTLRRLGGGPDKDRSRFVSDLPVEVDPWADLQGRLIPLCRAAVRPGARVDEWAMLDESAPYIARWMYGNGLVTWVAQDLGSPAIQSRTPLRQYGWGRVWDSVLGLRNATQMHPELAQQQGFPKSFVDKCKDIQQRYPRSTSYQTPDPSLSFLSSTEIQGRAAALVLLAIFFFIAYWLLACLGSHFFLLGRNKTQQSWVVFAVCAVAATAVTALFVSLVLRGPPELQHVSFIRWSATTDTRVTSQVGLLVKSDARLRVEMKDAAAGLVSTLSPLPMHTRHAAVMPEFLSYMEYDVPVPERSTASPAAIEVPFRRTLKKFQLDWTGPRIGGIEGSAEWGGNRIRGSLRNVTGHDLHQVYLVFNGGVGALDDTMLRLRAPDGKPAWRKGDVLRLEDLWAARKFLNTTSLTPNALCDYGLLNGGWMRSYDDKLRRADTGGLIDSRELSFLLLSVFDRIQPPARLSEKEPGYVIHRWTARRLDVSPAILAGHLVILARADHPLEDTSPLPLTLEVDRQKLTGKGSVYYQFVVPLARPSEGTPTTIPVEN